MLIAPDPQPNFQEGKSRKNFVKQEVQGSGINGGDYQLRTTNQP